MIITISPNMEAAKYAAVCSFDFRAIALAAWVAAESGIVMMNDS
jgi:hypothetical protein